MTVEDQHVTYKGLVFVVGGCLGLFYVDYGMVGSRDPEWFQDALNVLIGIFLPVKTGSDCHKVQCHGMIDRHNKVQDVGGGVRMAVHGKEGDVPKATERADPMLGL